MKNQQTFIDEVLEVQKKWNMEMIEKVYEHQKNQLKIIMNKFATQFNDVKSNDSTSE